MKGKSKKIIYAVSILLIVSSIFLIYNICKIRSIVIIGNKHLKEQEVILLAEIKEQGSIFHPSSKTIYEKLKRSPWIKDAIIRKDLSGTVTIFLMEAVPLALLYFNKREYLIDQDGQVLEELSESREKSENFLPVIKEIDPFNNKDTLHDAVKLINFVKSKNFVKNENQIEITGSNSETLTININNFSIIVGKGDYETKFSKYLIVLNEAQKRGLSLQYVDLRFPDRVVVKPIE